MIPENMTRFYINGAWVEPLSKARMGVENPATEETVCEVALGSVEDADRAILAARAAFDSWTVTPVAERIAVLKRVLEVYNSRYEDFAQAMSTEMGAPIEWARGAQAWAGQVHIESTIKAAEEMTWEYMRGTTRIVETTHGLVMAAAGVDASNTPAGTVVLLPVDPDASARALRRALAAALRCRIAVVLSDTFGRPWREGLTDVAIGAAGLAVLDDHRGRTDSHGNVLEMTVTAVADEVSSAADLVTGKTSGLAAAVAAAGASASFTATGKPPTSSRSSSSPIRSAKLRTNSSLPSTSNSRWLRLIRSRPR